MLKAMLLMCAPIKAGTSGYAVGAPFAEVPFAFNPEKITLSARAQRSSTPATAQSTDSSTFLGVMPRTMNLEMLLDAVEMTEPVLLEVYVNLLFGALESYDSLGGSAADAQPFVVFQWGPKPYTGTLKSVDVTYTLFNSLGVATRAECRLTIEERRLGFAKTNPTSGARRASKRRAVTSSVSLAHIAAAEFGDPMMWRAIARYNDIEDPMRLPVGTDVLIPDSSELKDLQA
jgi:hypothetical protein